MQNRKLRIVKNTSLAASDVFEDFLIAKRAKGAKAKTAETYRNHFRAISHHLDTSIDISDFNKRMYEQMIEAAMNYVKRHEKWVMRKRAWNGIKKSNCNTL